MYMLDKNGLVFVFMNNNVLILLRRDGLRCRVINNVHRDLTRLDNAQNYRFVTIFRSRGSLWSRAANRFISCWASLNKDEGRSGGWARIDVSVGRLTKLSVRVIGRGFAVLDTFGSRLVETILENALAHCLRWVGIVVQ